MNSERQYMFMDYIDYLFRSGRSHDYIARYIKAVKNFLEKTESVTKTGYMRYQRQYASDIIKDRLTRDAICDFLNNRGVGYRREKRGKDNKPFEKLSVISDKNRKLLNDFINHLQQENDYSPSTLATYAFGAKQYFDYANEVSLDNYRRFVKTLEEKGFSPKTIRLRITALEKLSEFVKKPMKLKRPKFKKSLDVNNVPTEAEYNRLLDYLLTNPNKDYYFFIKILATTGARVSEFLQFQWEDILNGEVTLRGKGNKYRRFFFQQTLQKEVKDYMMKQGKSGYVAVGKYGRITSRGLSQNMKNWGKKCGIDERKMHPHAFRHFFAKMFLKKNKDIVQLADLLGHGSIETTRIYLQRSYEEQRRDFSRSVTW